MKEWLDLASKLQTGGVELVLITLLIGAVFTIRLLFVQLQTCNADRVKDIERLVKAIEINTFAHQEATRATEADTEMQRANRVLLEQNTQALQQMMIALLSGAKK